MDNVDDMRVSANGGTPKWMVYTGKSNLKMNLGVPSFQETSILDNLTIIIDDDND